jgi:hypothetical protein
MVVGSCHPVQLLYLNVIVHFIKLLNIRQQFSGVDFLLAEFLHYFIFDCELRVGGVEVKAESGATAFWAHHSFSVLCVLSFPFVIFEFTIQYFD